MVGYLIHDSGSGPVQGPTCDSGYERITDPLNPNLNRTIIADCPCQTCTDSRNGIDRPGFEGRDEWKHNDAPPPETPNYNKMLGYQRVATQRAAALVLDMALPVPPLEDIVLMIYRNPHADDALLRDLIRSAQITAMALSDA